MGITAQGYKVRFIDEIRQEIVDELKILYPTLSFAPQSFEGHLVDNVADKIYQLERKNLAVFNNTPSTAVGVGLDSFALLKGLERFLATPAFAHITLVGNFETTVPVNTVIRDTQGLDYKVLDEVELDVACSGDVMRVEFSRVPTTGNWSLVINGTSETFAYDETDLTTHAKVSACEGNHAIGFILELTEEPLTISDSKTALFDAVINTQILEITGKFKKDTTVLCSRNGSFISAPYSIRNLISPPSGLLFGWNEAWGQEGTNDEADDAFFERFKDASGAVGNTVEGIKARLMAILNERESVDLIRKVAVREHFGAGTAGAPNPLEVYVSGGITKGQLIAQVIRLQLVSAGIELLGDEDYTVIDSDGYPHNSKFSRFARKDIYANIEIEVDATIFPGIEAVKEAIVVWGNGLQPGQDVIRLPQMVGALKDITGILNIDTLELSDNGTTFVEDNIAIAEYEESSWDISNISVTVI